MDNPVEPESNAEATVNTGGLPETDILDSIQTEKSDEAQSIEQSAAEELKPAEIEAQNVEPVAIDQAALENIIKEATESELVEDDKKSEEIAVEEFPELSGNTGDKLVAESADAQEEPENNEDKLETENTDVLELSENDEPKELAESNNVKELSGNTDAKELPGNTEDEEVENMEVEESEDSLEKRMGVKGKGTPTVKAFSSSAQRQKPQHGSFSLGVPGLTFSSQNLKVANDGTKMVQIHQSQITPDQLKALQANPNIKVVFRHIPSGKSFTKPPKNLFSSLTKGQKRRMSEEGDASVYNFDDDAENDYYQPHSKMSNMGNGNRYARYNPIAGMRKRGPGRPLSNHSYGGIGGVRQSMPTQIQLTDALAKLNKENAPYSVNIHVSQVTHGILSGMELHPDFNIVLTSKHEVPPEQSLEELVKEWAEKEAISPASSLIGADDKAPKKSEEEVAPEEEEVEESEEQMLENDARMEAEKMEEEQRLQEEEEAIRLKNERREREEAELLAAAMSEKTSRSGRIRKPSRYSLDIARITKRRTLYDDSEIEDEDEPIPSPPTPPRVVPTPPPPGAKKKGRGRPRKIRPEDLLPPPAAEEPVIETPTISLSSKRAEEEKRAEEKKAEEKRAEEKKAEEKKAEEKKAEEKKEEEKSEKQESNEPRVMLSPADKRMAENMLLQDSGLEGKKKEDSEDVAMEVDEKDDSKKEATKSDDVTKNNSDSAKPDDVTKSDDVKKSDDVTTSDDVKKSDDVTTSKDVKKSDDVTKSDNVTKSDDVTNKSDDVTNKSDDVTNKSDDGDLMKAVDEAIKASQESKPDAAEEESPSEVLARKLSMDADEEKKKEEVEEATSSIKDFVEEEGDVDNKYRLRKLLQQCSIEEIRSVAIPRALDAISIGDFFLHKADQMSRKEVSFAALYKQLESLHSSISREATRYSTLLKRANKIGGGRRMEKVILMPIYNKQAADTLNLTSSSIDAHICTIQPKTTAQMIAANSFRMNCKMEPPVHRLNIPDLAEKSQSRMKRKNFGRSSTQPGPNTTPYHPLLPTRRTNNMTKPSANNYNTGNSQRGSWKRGYQVRKPTYLTPSTTQSALQEHARMQLANRYQSQLVESRENALVTTTTLQQPDQAIMSTSENGAATAAMVDPSAVMTTEEGGVIAPEEGKQLVAIGDGQYVELPEGYTLIQTEDGYIIGQPGATFVQGEDGNVYMTNTDENNAEITDQVLTTTPGITESGEKIMEQLTT